MIVQSIDTAPETRQPGAVLQDQSEVVDFLADGAGTGRRADDIIETHGAMVFLCGDRVYKLKRAVWFPYMDFSTLQRRRDCCRAEITLNRRTAPTLYIDALPVTRQADRRLALGGGGDELDWVVVMRRFDQEALFDNMARGGTLDDDLMERSADVVAAFHGGAERRDDMDFAGSMARVLAGNASSLDRFSPAIFVPEAVAALRRRCHVLFRDAESALRRRARQGFVRWCHGDLHLRNMCLVDGEPTLFDCIEFDERLAVIDLYYDLAFLLMDLEHRGMGGYANLIFNRYVARTGDYGGVALLPLFMAARAAIRAHVVAAAAEAVDDPAARRARLREARSYLGLALRVSITENPGLIAIGGLSGSGKSRLARAMAPYIGNAPGALIARTDVVRKQMFGVDLFDALPQEAYSKDRGREVYARLMSVCRDALAAGRWAVADAVFADPSEREAIARVAATLDRPFLGIWLDVPEAVQRSRLSRREGDVSDASEAVGRTQRAALTMPDDWPIVDAGGTLDDTAAQAWRLLETHPIAHATPTAAIPLEGSQ